MPKHDFMSPKAISNRIKAKGLQKLRWYCEMCQKQCRDENGFKCHQTADSHLRQMKIFAENPGAVMHNYSNEFEENFIDTLSRRHGTKRTHANVCYQEYIADKHHVHMNATRWETLSNFVKYLGKSGQAVVDETEKGWYIAWIDRDPAALARQAQLARKRKHDMDDEDRLRAEMKRRVEAGGGAELVEVAADNSLRERAADAKVVVGAVGLAKRAPAAAAKRPAGGAFGAESSSDSEQGDCTPAASSGKRGGAMLAALCKSGAAPAQAHAKRDEDDSEDSSDSDDSAARVEAWLVPGIVVKLVNKAVGGGAYYKKKGVVLRLASEFAAVVKVVDSGDEIQLDQDDLETVIPAAGRTVQIVNGQCRGARATVLSINVDDFSIAVKIDAGKHAGRVLAKVEYEDVTKLA